MFDFPNSPGTGQTVTNGSATYRFDGTKWAVAGAAGGGASITVSDTPPPSPTPGALWWDSVGGQLYVNYADPNSVEWVIANTGGIPDAPAADGNTYARSNQQWVAITGAVAAAPNNTGRNLIHNGQFNICQRAVSGWNASGVYTFDRWRLDIGGGDTLGANSVALADADRSQIGDESATTAMSGLFTGSATANSYNAIIQRLEGVRRFGNRQITVSFYAKATSGTPKIGVYFQQFFGTGGSPSTFVNTPVGATVALSTTWGRYTLTVSLPSVAGKTFGTTAGSDYGQLGLALSDVSNLTGTGIGQQSGTIQFWGVQLEVGSVATPLAKRDPADELALCQRFYQSLYTLISFPFNPSTAGWTANWTLPLLVSMRAAPSIVFSGTTYTNAQNLRLGMTATPSFVALAADAVSTSGGFGVNSAAALSADL